MMELLILTFKVGEQYVNHVITDLSYFAALAED